MDVYLLHHTNMKTDSDYSTCLQVSRLPLQLVSDNAIICMAATLLSERWGVLLNRVSFTFVAI